MCPLDTHHFLGVSFDIEFELELSGFFFLVYLCAYETFQFRSKTCLIALSIRSILPGKDCTSAPSWVKFFQLKIERITHLLSIRTTTSWKMLTNNKFKAQTLTGNPTGNLRCHVLASRALNKSLCFDQSTRSIESRCVVTVWCCHGSPWAFAEQNDCNESLIWRIAIAL